MAMIIRLRQMGRNNQQTYRVIVTDERTRRDGRYIEALGWYNPQNNTDHLHIEVERVLHWFNLGAQISENVMKLVEKMSPETANAIVAKKSQKVLKERQKRRTLRAKRATKSGAKAPIKAVSSEKKETKAVKKPVARKKKPSSTAE